MENTIAVMQPASIRRYSSSRGKPASKTWSQEIWAMYQIQGSGVRSKYQETNSKKIPNLQIQNSKPNKLTKLKAKKLKIISAWRYPGVSPKNNPIPEEILREIRDTIQ